MLRIKALGAAAIGATAIGLSMLDTAPTQAAVITKNFQVEITSGSLLGQSFSGSVQYDDSFLPQFNGQFLGGLFALTPQNGLLDLSFEFLGETFTEEDDIGFSSAPQAIFDNGSLIGLNYFVNEFVTPIPDPFVSFGIQGNIFEYGTDSELSFGTVTFGTQQPEPIPTPALLPGLIGMGVAAIRKRKQERVEAEV